MKQVALFLFLLINTISFSQNITGVIKNTNDETLSGAHIVVGETEIAVISDKKGNFSIDFSETKTITLHVSFVGYKPKQEIIDLNLQATIEIILEPDFLNLEEVFITGTLIPSANKNLSVPVSSVSNKEITRFGTGGSAAILQRVPGVYVDASAGEVYTRVYTRGISISAEDDLGWYYVGLHEDGLPVTAVQFGSFAPDLFHRIDGTLSHIEAVRGGSASIVGVNTPGGVFNFISKPITSYFQGELSINTGLEYNGNLYNKIDATFSGPLSEKFGYQIGLSHRIDQGSRNIDYDLSKGGQISYKLNYKFEKGKLELYGKYLNDHVNRWTGVAAKNWDNPVAAYDQNFKTTAQLLPDVSNQIPDGTGGYYEFDPSNGIHVKDITAGLLFETELSDNWSLENNFKYSAKSSNWQTSLSNAILPLDGFLPYFISGADFPIGQVVFRDTKSTQEVARVDNSGIFGDPPGFNYLTDGTLPNDAILGVAAWYKDDKNDELMNQLTLHGKLENHELRGGVFASLSKIETLTRASFSYATFEAQPEPLTATLENPGTDILYLSDDRGYSNYGGLFYEKAQADVSQIHFFVQDQWKLNEKFLLDIGLRFNHINHNGSKDRSAPLQKDGGWDGDPKTAYDNGILISSGVVDKFDFNYDKLSYSVGLNYKVGENLNAFGRFSKGDKAPELNYYFSNFTNVPINEAGPTQKIIQVETGVKFSGKQITIVPVLFYSELSNVGISNFVFDEGSNNIFYTPMQFNSTRTFGLELESVYHPFDNFSVKMNATFQDSKAIDFTVYNANGTIDPSDDEIRAYDGNKLPFNPSVMVDVTPEYHVNKLDFYLNWRYMGEREGNIANTFQLPAYSLFNLGASYQIVSGLNIGLHVKNAFSSEGLMSFTGPNSFGASKDDATQEYIDANPNGEFIVTPVQPRMFYLTLNYKF